MKHQHRIKESGSWQTAQWNLVHNKAKKRVLFKQDKEAQRSIDNSSITV